MALLAAIPLLMGCRGEEEPAARSSDATVEQYQADLDTEPIGVFEGVSASAPASFRAVNVGAAESYWTGMTAIAVVGAETFRIVEAEPLIGSEFEDAAVYVGRPGVSGMLGNTPNEFPGSGETPESPIPAVGVELPPDDAFVVYVTGTPSGAGGTYVLGSELTVESTTTGTRFGVTVMSPALLCDSDVPRDESGYWTAGGVPSDCRDAETEFLAAAQERFGVEIP